ncbi:transmembrane protein 209-like [Drosophila pseudoobscura]|uniref:Transmembrane protein 209-like n=1 Tax=Drosophila pseudoobscura pseudoobscura TaxID=46245 RepID=A0A6I8UWT9_DROPS|nr:transmembrane protein 209 [Drosophila pseudoobscura]
MNRSRNKCSPMLQKSLDMRLRGAQAKAYLKRGAFNVLVLLLLLLHLSVACRCQRRGYFFAAECAVATVVALNAVACLAKYSWLWLSGVHGIGTYAQKCLLDGYDGNSFSTICVQKEKKPRCPEVEPCFKDYVINWHSSFEDSRCRPRRSLGRTPQRQSGCAEAPPDDCLTDVRRLPALMKSARRHRRSSEIADGPSAQPTSPGNAFWRCCNNQSIEPRTIYQLAPPPSPACAENAPTTFEEFSSFQFKDSSSEVIGRIATDKLPQYVANLRHWISTTVLQRLVSEIDNVDKGFRQRGLCDMKIGAVGLERLRVAAECAPTLPTLLLFLEGFSNQEYLVQRIRDLSQGSRLANFGRHDPEPASNLPSDAAIVFHLFCAYLDSQLMLTHQPRGGWRPFRHYYVLVRDDRRSLAAKDLALAVHNQAQCAILCSGSPLDPKFNFISGRELHSCAYDRNHLFCVILQFLLYMRQRQGSSLEGVSLGKGGINIMCVIDN